MIGRERAWHIPARVQMREIEIVRVASQVLLQTERREKLQMVSQTVGNIGKNPQLHAIVRRAPSSGQARRVVTGICCAHRDVMPAPRKRSRTPSRASA